MTESNPELSLEPLTGPVRDWFARTFPAGPTPVQAAAWPTIAAGESVLLVSPTGTGKTLAAFLAILDRLFREHAEERLGAGLRCVYVSPLRSLAYDISRNLMGPLEAIRRERDLEHGPVTVGVRTGDTTACDRRKLRDAPPHLLITTPESLSLLLSQSAWHAHWDSVEQIIVDEVHALVPTKRGVDLSVSLERLSARARRDPCRIGLSATCRPAEPVAAYLVGPMRSCRILEAACPQGHGTAQIDVESLLRRDEGPHRGLTYRRLLQRLKRAMQNARTTVIFANTRALTEKITLDLRCGGYALPPIPPYQGGEPEREIPTDPAILPGEVLDPRTPGVWAERRVVEPRNPPMRACAGRDTGGLRRSTTRCSAHSTESLSTAKIPPRELDNERLGGVRTAAPDPPNVLTDACVPAQVAAHHSALDASRRRAVEAALKAGELRAVVTSTSLELGVDIGSADLSVLVGLPGSVARCLQRVGRSGHRLGAKTRGLVLAATAAELAGAAVTARAAREGRVEPLRCVAAPLDVLCQQLIGMACGDEWSADAAFDLVRRAQPMASLTRADFDACLEFLAGALASPPGAFEPEPGAAPRWTSPRLWHERGRFGFRSARVVRWFRRNVGTITSEESVRVVVHGTDLGTLEGSYADRLQPGDRFVLDGRSLAFQRREGFALQAKTAGGEPELPRWTSDRQSLSPELARDLSAFREHAATLLVEGPAALRSWLAEAYDLDPDAAGLLEDLFVAQEQASEVPPPGALLIEESPHPDGWSYAFHAPLSRSACEALGRALAARLGRRFGRDLALAVADLGWSFRLSDDARLESHDVPALLALDHFEDDILEGLDRGDLLARRFRHVASTALMVLRNPDRGRTRVGGMHWVANRLYPLVNAACPDHPLLRETRREVLEDLLDARTARAWLAGRPEVRFRRLAAPSPFTAAWIDPAGPEPLHFEPPEEALRRLHGRLAAVEVER
jgi:Lhr-like helicase